MKKDKLDCIGYIDSQLIEKAEDYKVRKKKNIMASWGAVAACLCIVLAATAIVFLSRHFPVTCSNKTLLIAGEFESGNLLSGKVDIDLSTKFEKKIQKINDTYEYRLNEEVIVCKYEDTILSPYYNGDVDEYIALGSNGRDIYLMVDETKKLVSYSILYRKGYTTTQNKSYEECLEIAKSKLAEFDDGEYVQILNYGYSKLTNIPERGDVYSFYFRKDFNGNLSNNIFSILVNTDGMIVDLCLRDIYEFNDEDAAFLKEYKPNEDLLMEEIKNELLPKLKTDDAENIIIELNKSYFCKLKDGHLYNICELKITDKETLESGKDFEYNYLQILKRIS